MISVDADEPDSYYMNQMVKENKFPPTLKRHVDDLKHLSLRKQTFDKPFKLLTIDNGFGKRGKGTRSKFLSFVIEIRYITLIMFNFFRF